MLRALTTLTLTLPLTSCMLTSVFAPRHQLDEARAALAEVDDDGAFGAKLIERELKHIEKTSPKRPTVTTQTDVAPPVNAPEDTADDAHPRLALHAVHGRAEITEPASTDAGLAPQRTAEDDMAETSYESALLQLNRGEYTHAADEFTAFVEQHPNHRLTANATYWRGEAFFARRDFAHARDDFSAIVSRYPKSTKLPDALYKASVCERELGHRPEAAAYLDRLIRLYPRSDAARLAATQR